MPLRSIIEEQIGANEFDLEMKGFSFSKDVLEDIKNSKFQVIYASAEQALSNLPMLLSSRIIQHEFHFELLVVLLASLLVLVSACIFRLDIQWKAR